MPFLTHPQSFADANQDVFATPLLAQGSLLKMLTEGRVPPHSSHPDFTHLTLLVFEAVLEVVFVSLPGYIVARQGMFDADAQKMVANLNVMVFTPCLIFTKLASQLNAKKLIELGVIPFIFFAQILVSYLSALFVSKCFGFDKRPRNFVVAMGVFGNSNSLPISLVVSLSKTISGLHWDRIPGDNDNEVAARGILYLLIFQQLGQLVRWTWGYHILLAPPPASAEQQLMQAEEGSMISHDGSTEHSADTRVDHTNTISGDQTPLTHEQYTAPVSPASPSLVGGLHRPKAPELMPTPTNGNIMPRLDGQERNYDADESMGSPPAVESTTDSQHGPRGFTRRCRLSIHRAMRRVGRFISGRSTAAFHTLPKSVQVNVGRFYVGLRFFVHGLWGFMNPPLWAMLVAIFVASMPRLQRLFFEDGSFIKNSITSAIKQSGGVAVPLILVVLGANLARNTLPQEDHGPEHRKEDMKLVIASLLSRMLLPTVIMAPLMAVTAKMLHVSILSDPIFIIVVFLLIGAPSALQLAQICQINNVYMGAMSKLLFQSYVVWILPSTLILVMLAMEVVEWAAV